MKYPYQRAYWTRRRVGLLVVLAVLALIGGTTPQGLPDLLGLSFGLVLLTVVLAAFHNGVRQLLDRKGDRGQIGIVRFFLALGVGAILVFLVTQVTNPLLERAAKQSAGTAAADGTQWLTTAGEYLPVIYLFVAFFGLIALAIYQRGVGGPR